VGWDCGTKLDTAHNPNLAYQVWSSLHFLSTLNSLCTSPPYEVAQSAEDELVEKNLLVVQNTVNFYMDMALVVQNTVNFYMDMAYIMSITQQNRIIHFI